MARYDQTVAEAVVGDDFSDAMQAVSTGLSRASRWVGPAKAIVLHTPTCADQSDAIRKVREATMIANAAIALGGRLHHDRQPDRVGE